MPRLARFDLPHIPQHIVQRGHDRLPCFAAEQDYVRYLAELKAASSKHGCAIHAYVLMTNHVHLLATPFGTGAVSRMMQALGRRYVGGFNARYQRSGTLWEGRYRSCLVDTDDYLLRCYRYIELNPVRAGMVQSPGEYRWSSFAANGMGMGASLLDPHATYLALGKDARSRALAYFHWVSQGDQTDELEQIRNYVRQGRAWGGTRFQAHIESLLGRTATTRTRGRPSQGQRR